MEYPIHIIPGYQYQPYFTSIQQDSDPYDGSHPFDRHHMNRLPAIGSPMHATTMDRFLQEQDRALFTARVNTPLPPFPSLDLEPTGYYGANGHLDYPYRHPSPTDSTPSSAYHSSGPSDNQSTPLSSPNPSVFARSPETVYLEHPGYGYGMRYTYEEFKGGMSGPCVTMHEVQGYEDAQPEAIRFEDEGNYYAALPQEGFEPMEQEPVQEHTVNGIVSSVINGTGSPHGDGNAPSSPESPNIRRRRPTATRSVTSPNKVAKRPTSRRTSSFSKANGHKTNGYCQSASNRAFPCPFAIYNCTATFGAKNEWKRHVNTQHMQTGYWRCDQCDQSERKPNDFNRKDLFIQHVRRMHPLEVEKPTKTKSTSSRPAKNDPEEQKLNAIASRCLMPIRDPPEECACIVCDAVFTGSTAWDERLEHIGKHFEAMKKEGDEPSDPKEWREDDNLHEFLAKQRIIAYEGKRWVLA